MSRHTARLTIKFLHIVDKPIRTRACDLARGPIWDAGYATRPGMGLTMVIDAHDVTPVPGYGAHGPFYRLYLVKPGYLAKIKWNGVWRTYRFVTKPTPYPQRPKSEVDKPIKSFLGEVVYFRCCWPRYYIAQNGIEIASGASASVTGNTVSGNWYTGPTYTACGLLFIQAGGVKQSANTLFANQTNLCNAGRGGGNYKP